jgi:hypothetical protein
MPPEILSSLAALPPPGPGDATAEERRTLLRGALPANAMPEPAQLPDQGIWFTTSTNNWSAEVQATRHAVCLLRVRPLARAPPTRCRAQNTPLLEPVPPQMIHLYLCLSHLAHPQAVPRVWVAKLALKAALAGRSAGSDSALARIGGRRLGPYEVLLGRRSGRDYLMLRAATDEAAAGLPPPPDAAEIAAAAAAAAPAIFPEFPYALPATPAAADSSPADEAAARNASSLLNLPAVTEAATGLRSLPSVAVPQAAVPSAAAAAAAGPALPTAGWAPALPASILPPEVAALLAVLPPPGPSDASAEERAALLATALPGDALPVLAARPEGGAWGRRPTRPELEAVCCALRLLRVRSSCRHLLAAARRLPVCARCFIAARWLARILPTHL